MSLPVRLSLALMSIPALVAGPARAGDLFGGLYVHDVKTPLDLSGIEGGADVLAGYRFGAIGTTPIRPYVFAALNTAGETSYAALGLSARFGRRVYVRPGLGVAIHNGSAAAYYRTDRVAFGSRILFEPELGIGVQVSPRLSVEASIVHMSHAQLFGGENPGIDNIGLRANLRL